ncbi:MAG: endonuclease/exonuclease/phosphatase family protein [Gemmataceae bacterium]
MTKQERKTFLFLGVLLALLLVIVGQFWSSYRSRSEVPEEGYLFCFWNVENLFDDRADGRNFPADQQYDEWFSGQPTDLRQKLDNLSHAIVNMNARRGPDILALAEVENIRAAQLLQDTLNRRLPPELAYKNLLMKEQTSGRHIAPAILTRLPVRGNKTQLLGSRMRTLEGHLVVNGYDLVVVVSHWTSRVTDKDGSRRCRYGEQIYGQYKAMSISNPDVAFLVCGDFNDPPSARSVTTCLRAVGDQEAVLHAPHTEPLLYNLFAPLEAKGQGTLYYRGKWDLFDQIAVSPALLRNQVGWVCLPRTAQVFNTLYQPGDPTRQPWRFGDPKDSGPRGYSDHFPVTVRLNVLAKKPVVPTFAPATKRHATTLSPVGE